MDLGLKGLKALIPAGSKGLGFGIASELVKEGAKVSIASRSEENVEEAVTKLQELGGENCAVGAAVDVRNLDQVEKWVKQSAGELGSIDILVLNSGGPPAGNFEQVSTSDWRDAFELSLLSGVELTRAALPFLKTKGGAILGITSSSIKQPIENLILSNVFRSGTAALLKSLSIELAPFSIRVNNIVPGRVDTERVRQLDQIASQKSGASLADVVADKHKEIPLGRYADTEEFARAAAFLVSPAASYITGETLFVDGGMVKSM